jgi:hypothetical protein
MQIIVVVNLQIQLKYIYKNTIYIFLVMMGGWRLTHGHTIV